MFETYKPLEAKEGDPPLGGTLLKVTAKTSLSANTRRSTDNREWTPEGQLCSVITVSVSLNR